MIFGIFFALTSSSAFAEETESQKWFLKVYLDSERDHESIGIHLYRKEGRLEGTLYKGLFFETPHVGFTGAIGIPAENVEFNAQDGTLEMIFSEKYVREGNQFFRDNAFVRTFKVQRNTDGAFCGTFDILMPMNKTQCIPSQTFVTGSAKEVVIKSLTRALELIDVGDFDGAHQLLFKPPKRALGQRDRISKENKEQLVGTVRATFDGIKKGAECKYLSIGPVSRVVCTVGEPMWIHESSLPR